MYNTFKSHIKMTSDELVEASVAGDLRAVYDLINKKSINVNHKNATNITALYGACSLGHVYVVKYLLRSGADLSAKNGEIGHSCLHAAAGGGFVNILELLLNNGIHIETVNDRGKTALHQAACENQLEALKYLQSRGAKVNTIAEHMQLSVLTAPAIQGHFRTVQWLLDQGCDLHHRDDTGWTVLHYACQSGKLDVLRLLINRGAKVNAVSDDGDTALFTAARNGHDEVLRCLIYNGSNIHHTNNLGATAMHMAAIEGSLPCVKILIQQGAKVDAEDSTRTTPFLYACQYGNLPVMEYLSEKGANIFKHDTGHNDSALTNASVSENIQAVEWLLNRGLNVNHVINQSLSDLCRVLDIKQLDFVQNLAKESDTREGQHIVGCTGFILACMRGDLVTMKLLTEHGANMHVVCDVIGATALTVAGICGHTEVADWLIQQGLDVNHLTRNGMSPVMVAASNGHSDIVTLLLQHKANPDLRNKDNLTARQLAQINNHQAIVQILYSPDKGLESTKL